MGSGAGPGLVRGRVGEGRGGVGRGHREEAGARRHLGHLLPVSGRGQTRLLGGIKQGLREIEDLVVFWVGGADGAGG